MEIQGRYRGDIVEMATLLGRDLETLDVGAEEADAEVRRLGKG